KSRDHKLKIKMADDEEEEEAEEPEDLDWGTVLEEEFYGFPVDEESLKRIAQIAEQKDIIEAEEFMEFAEAGVQSGKTAPHLLLEYGKVTRNDLAELEADFMEVPLINLTTYSIDKKIGHMLKEDFCKLNNVVPVQMAGNDLLVAMIDPSDEDVIADMTSLTGFGIKPGKCLKAALTEQLDLLYPKAKVSGRDKKGRPKRLGDILKELGYVKEVDVEKAFQYGKENKVRLGEALIHLELCSNKQISLALSKQYQLPYIDLDDSLMDPIVADVLPKKLCYDYTVVVVKYDQKSITIAMEDPTDIITLDHIKMITEAQIEIVIANNASILAALDKLFGDTDDLMDAWEDDVGAEEEASGFDDDSAPIIKLVNMCISEAVKIKVSDIHIESFEDDTLIRFRKDGTMNLYMSPPKAAYPAIISRLKIMSNLNIAENRLPQDGRIQIRIGKKKVDLRVSILPCVWGEKVVMRILDQENLKVNLKELGFEPKVLKWFTEGLKSPNGVVLVTGPTGSGKTTTLYSALTAVNKPGENIMTAEDPAEFNLPGINQVNCNAAIGLDFSACLRAFLRQDPDIIMVGEIRDFETASIAFKAAMTGHLVLSTLHTNDAPGTVSRLLQMGIEAFMIATAVRIVQAQRLVKTVCSRCKESFKPNQEQLDSLNLDQDLLKKLAIEDDFSLDTLEYWRAKGCDSCGGKGYAGRMGIYEVMRMNEKMRTCVLSNPTPEKVRIVALTDGMLSLRESATFKMLHGYTSVDQILAVTKAEKAVKLDKDGNPIIKRRYTRKQLLDMGIDPDEYKKQQQAGTEDEFMNGGSQAAVSAPATASSGGAVVGDPGVFKNILSEIRELKGELTSTTPGVSGDSSGFNFKATENLSKLVKQLKTHSMANLKSKGDAKKDSAVKMSLFRNAALLERNMENLLVNLELPRDLKPVKVKMPDVLDKYLFAEFKNFQAMAGFLKVGTALPAVSLAKAYAANIPPVVVDLMTMKLLFRELCLNAIMAIETKGQLKITLRFKDGAVYLQFFDTGAGISKENLEKVFIPFNSTFKSNGLGLSNCKKILEEIYNGKISIKSQEKKATVVDLVFPANGKALLAFVKKQKAS
ncbi:ATPase, T2SS/T4P/T4SS family, partial [Candidatus Riflebacteria bacterium]